MAFIGEFKVSITAGGRIVLPKKIRENVRGETFILTKGFDVCLGGYDKDDWDNRSNALLQVSLLDKEDISKRRYIFSGAQEIAVDAQGRFVIPKALASFIGAVDSEVIIIGVGDHFEIWEAARWKEYAYTSISN